MRKCRFFIDNSEITEELFTRLRFLSNLHRIRLDFDSFFSFKLNCNVHMVKSPYYYLVKDKFEQQVK